MDKPTEPAQGVDGHTAGGGIFRSVVCGVDRRVDSRAALDHALLFAPSRDAVNVVPTRRLTGRPHCALRDACEGHDLLALGAGADATDVVEHAPIPVLIGRWNPPVTAVTDRILVPVDDSLESRRALRLAGRLVAAHGGSVTVLIAPQHDAALQRAINASRDILRQATGALPTVLGDQLRRERAIPAAARAINASLVILGTGETVEARRMAAQIVGRLDASALAVPPPALAVGPHDTAEADAVRRNPSRNPGAGAPAAGDGNERIGSRPCPGSTTGPPRPS